jgi:molecular chaperone GrpE (heat shock protein)
MNANDNIEQNINNEAGNSEFSQLDSLSLEQLLGILAQGVEKVDANDKKQQGARALVMSVKKKADSVLKEVDKLKDEINTQHENHILEQKRLRGKNKEECEEIKVYGNANIIENVILQLIDALEACVSMIGHVKMDTNDGSDAANDANNAEHDNNNYKTKLHHLVDTVVEFKKAIRMSILKVIEKLQRYHVYRICPAVGDVFNANEHMIISSKIDSSMSHTDPSIIEEVSQPGYKIEHHDGITKYNRVIRSAMVVVKKGA